MLTPIGIGIVLVAVAPFIVAPAGTLAVSRLGNSAGVFLACIPGAIFVFLCTLIARVSGGETIIVSLPWAPSYGIDFSLLVDGLSLTFALVVSGIGTLIVLYAGAYLAGHPHQGRFLGFILAFMGAMLGLVLSDDMALLYVFWELTAVTSFLLIGFDHRRQSARRAAVQALVVTSAGGLALLLAFVILHELGGGWEISGLRLSAHGAISASSAYPLVLLLVAAGAFTKSAQLPFHFWLPNAMEAPTPVSAFLHSATMVQAGVYLLARLSPVLGDTALWTGLLTVFGGATLLWGGLGGLRQTDLKQMLAQSTIASLGLLVLLIGIGGEIGIAAMIVYFLAHAFYKAGFFLVAGLIDHETGLRDITALGGLRDKMALTFIAALLAGFSMLGLPPALGYLAKEEMYRPTALAEWQQIVLLAVMVLGNAALGTVGLTVALRPFLGTLLPTPKDPHDGPAAMLIGPLLLGLAGFAAAILSTWSIAFIVAPAATSVLGHAAAVHLGFVPDLATPGVWLSLLTWALAVLLFWRLDSIRTVLRRLDRPHWQADHIYDLAMTGLVLGAGRFARLWQNGRLRLYLSVVFLVMAAALLLPMFTLGGALPPMNVPHLRPAEWGVIGLAILGLGIVLTARSLLIGILALGVQGLAMALIYLLFGAPDLSFTQFMVETLSVVMFALVMVRLRLDGHERRPLPVAFRDAVLAALGGVAVAASLLAVLSRPLDTRLSTFFEQNSVLLAHGHNIVNVILVDFRGLDTLGEISVVMTAGIAILALIGSGFFGSRRRPAQPEQGVDP